MEYLTIPVINYISHIMFYYLSNYLVYCVLF